jgi:hypothetical protein
MLMQASLKNTLSQTTSVAGANSIEVIVSDASTVVLRGVLHSEEDRIAAEGLIRLEPGMGFYFVRNEILVDGKTP